MQNAKMSPKQIAELMGNCEKVYFRVHWSDCPEFCDDNAYSRGWSEDISEETDIRGYSCFDNPQRLLRYFENRGGFDGHSVYAFKGKWIGTGPDDEDLAVPVELLAILAEDQAKEVIVNCDWL
jgi:hypothetical protein